MSTRPFLLVALVVVLTATLAGCDEQTTGTATPAPTVTVTVTESVEPSPTPTPEPSPEPSTDACSRLGEVGEGMAFLVVSSPVAGEEIPSPFTVEGCGNVFEAAFQWELLDRDGERLDRGSGMATCGTGCVGTYRFSVSYAVGERQVGTLRVFASSARDGSDEHVNAIPVLLVP